MPLYWIRRGCQAGLEKTEGILAVVAVVVVVRSREVSVGKACDVNVIVGEADQYGKRIKISARLLRFRSTTRYDYTIALAFGYILLDTFFLLLLDFGNYSFRRSPLF